MANEGHQSDPLLHVSELESPNGLFFYHTVDGLRATLQVRFLGSQLFHKFEHESLTRALPAGTISRQLEAKTAGFSAVVSSTGKRIIMTWAESGHGAGSHGDHLVPSQDTLPNYIWAKRMRHLAKVLDLRMSHSFDGMGARRQEDTMGLFQSAHVEVKLATHAIYTLMSYFKIISRTSLGDVSIHHLRRLQHVTWDDGTRPSFEIYFSRKKCTRCAVFIRGLERATGIKLSIQWRERLA